jgi:hypothetical protein
MHFALFLSILENALMAIIFQRENVVINLGSLKEQLYPLICSSTPDATAYKSNPDTAEPPIKDSLNIRPD